MRVDELKVKTRWKFNIYDVIQDGANLKLAKTDDISRDLEDEIQSVVSDENSENKEFEIDESFSPNFEAYEEQIHDSFQGLDQKSASGPKSDLELMNELKAKVFDYTGNFQNFQTGNFYDFFAFFGDILKFNFRPIFEF